MNNSDGQCLKIACFAVLVETRYAVAARNIPTIVVSSKPFHGTDERTDKERARQPAMRNGASRSLLGGSSNNQSRFVV